MNPAVRFLHFPTGLIGEELLTVPLSHRYAEKEDIPQIFVMYLNALDELEEKYDEKKALDFVLSCWSKAPCILLEDGGVIGFAGLNTYTPAYNNEVYLREYMFYIKPQFRGVQSWRSLCKAVQETADKFNLTFIGEHRLMGDLKHHERLIRMAGAKPKAIISVYGG
jgi:hypothetical protein